MMRDTKGRFLPGHPWASKGGEARAAKLTRQRRQEIARSGFQALADRHFDGDRRAAGQWLSAKGLHVLDARMYPNHVAFEDPGDLP